ncbi:MAG: CDP-diacylglycerol--serine O-phosphatidyltransferase [Elusimicrobia bacterium]|nr:CDP-diacylglycerol--serine O-phosphatidyltransferase [Elusimicrobiota bacterium]
MNESKKIKLEDIKRKGAFVLPSMFTLGNMAFGFFSVLAASNKEYLTACYFLIGSYFMDVMDGRIARLVHGESRFGVEFDSFADFMSFCVAPAYLMYNFGLKEYGFWAYPVSFLYVLCGALRLARFNLKSLDGESSKKFFQGLPTPAAAGIIISFVLSYSLLEADEPGRKIAFINYGMPYIYAFFPFIMIGLSLLMVSSVPYAAFKSGNLFRLKSVSGIIISVSIISMIIAFPQNSLFIFFSFYALSGIILLIYLSIFPKKEKEDDCPKNE